MKRRGERKRKMETNYMQVGRVHWKEPADRFAACHIRDGYVDDNKRFSLVSHGYGIIKIVLVDYRACTVEPVKSTKEGMSLAEERQLLYEPAVEMTMETTSIFLTKDKPEVSFVYDDESGEITEVVYPIAPGYSKLDGSAVKSAYQPMVNHLGGNIICTKCGEEVKSSMFHASEHLKVCKNDAPNCDIAMEKMFPYRGLRDAIKDPEYTAISIPSGGTLTKERLMDIMQSKMNTRSDAKYPGFFGVGVLSWIYSSGCEKSLRALLSSYDVMTNQAGADFIESVIIGGIYKVIPKFNEE